MAKKLYVGNLSYDTSDSDLQRLFEEYGKVDSAQVVRDRETGRSRGFGFVEMPDDQEAQAAIDGLNGQEAGGRAPTVNEAKPREDRGGRSGGGGRGRGGYGGGGGGGGRAGAGAAGAMKRCRLAFHFSCCALSDASRRAGHVGEAMPQPRTQPTRADRRRPALRSASQHGRGPAVVPGEVYRCGQAVLDFDRAENLYARWPTPVCILADGPDGVSGFPGDEHRAVPLTA